MSDPGTGSRGHRLTHHDRLLPLDPDLAPDDPAEPSPVHRPTSHLHRSRDVGTVLAIVAGGFLGTVGRYGVQLVWPASPDSPDWATIVINTSGALLLGIVLTFILEHGQPRRYLRPFCAVGLLGGWTTMSTFAVETCTLAGGGHVLSAIAEVGVMFAAGLPAAGIGIATGRTLALRMRR